MHGRGPSAAACQHHAGRSHLLALIDGVLAARVEAGKQPILLEPVSIGPLVRECLALVRPLAEERRVVLDDDAAPADAVWVAADRTRLKQVLLNLLSNAIKYNREGGQVRLSISAGADGWGSPSPIPGSAGREQHEQLFTAFEHLGAETVRSGRGHRLALSGACWAMSAASGCTAKSA